MRVDAIDSGTSRKHGHCVASERLAPVAAALPSKAWQNVLVALMAATTAAVSQTGSGSGDGDGVIPK